jgi:hypothetical protein
MPTMIFNELVTELGDPFAGEPSTPAPTFRCEHGHGLVIGCADCDVASSPAGV